jgi:hypothetical protein
MSAGGCIRPPSRVVAMQGAIRTLQCAPQSPTRSELRTAKPRRTDYTDCIFFLISHSRWLRYGLRDSPVVTIRSFMIFSSSGSV